VPADDLYARLEVKPGASFETIEIAWRALLKRHHPDIAGADALEVAKRINVAHDWLSDPTLRERYDRERRQGNGHRPLGPSPPPRRAPIRVVHRPTPVDPATALRRFLDRVGRLNQDELDRLSVADTNSIAFVASIRRFLTAERQAAVEAVEGQVRARLRPADWATAPIRDAILAAGHEIVLGGFLDDNLSEPSRGRARDRLMRGWEAAIDQPRYGPNTRIVRRFIERAAMLDAEALTAMVRASGRTRIPPDPWPRGLDPEEDDGLRVSSALAGRDAIVAAARPLASLERSPARRAERLLGRTAHAFVLRHGFTADQFASLVAPWKAATGDPGTGRGADPLPGPIVRRR
jgi:curved DNA-binding protein CbpA